MARRQVCKTTVDRLSTTTSISSILSAVFAVGPVKQSIEPSPKAVYLTMELMGRFASMCEYRSTARLSNRKVQVSGIGTEKNESVVYHDEPFRGRNRGEKVCQYPLLWQMESPAIYSRWRLSSKFEKCSLEPQFVSNRVPLAEALVDKSFVSIA